ncbi:hypothetical protein COHA_001547 [Chlorella ohadii]|uniref:Uncharacterized protein n=1 Tax=Chlorella ohadii TaxID=2649997 RepID=A0AAD5DYF9_9CHLO|nr:hypothetical protein COHA_001547 [Chlorella ohadii]
MRTLLYLALLALAAPALANNWPPQKAPRFEAVGTALANNKGVGFDGKPYTWTADPVNGAVNIVSDLLHKPMKWQLVGVAADGPTLHGFASSTSTPQSNPKQTPLYNPLPFGGDPQGQQSLVSVSWAYGAVVKTDVDPLTTDLKVVLYGNKVIEITPRRPFVLGGLSITSSGGKWSRWGVTPRKVEITVRPLIKIIITQPWLPPLAPGQKGAFAPYLEVKVVLTEKPQNLLTGDLGVTYVPSLKDQLIAAKIIRDVINDVAPIKGLDMETKFQLAGGALLFSNGQLLPLADVANPPTLAITGARPWDKFVLFVVDPDAPEPIPASGDLTDLKTKASPTGGVAGAGAHRYVFVLYKQPKWFKGFKPIVVPTDPAEVAKVLGKWNLNKVAWQKNLGQPIDVTWCVL